MDAPATSVSAFTPWGKRRADSISSQDTSSLHDRGRNRSVSNAIPPRLPFHSQDSRSLLGNESRLSSSLASSHQPIRSFINPAHRDHLAPVSTLQQARSVREDTAELATYQLADKAERRHSSILTRNRSQSFRTAISSSDQDNEDADSRAPTTSDLIEETSEPELSPSEEVERQLSEASSLFDEDEEPVPNRNGGDDDEDDEDDEEDGPSLLTRALRRSPPHSLDSNADPQLSGDRPRGSGSSRRIFEEPVNASDNNSTAVFSDGEEDEPAADSGSRFHQVVAPQIPTAPATEVTPLLGAANGRSYDIEAQKTTAKSRFLSVFGARTPADGPHPIKARVNKAVQSVTHIKSLDRKRVWESVVLAPAACLPAVIVGLLLNILDALSYGMILFPLGSPIFAHLGSAGISIFYVSTIISQITFSSGSIFKGCVGSELIEVVPFFHNMALTITDIVGADQPDAVIATTITAYAASAMVTGSVFYLMGHFQFGYIVGFIPRHILIGCIGGVGWFLVATGFEVTARIEGSLEYDLETLHKLLRGDTIALWTIPLALSIALFWGQKQVKSKFFLPLYIMAIPFAFYIFTTGIGAKPSGLRHDGWVFTGPPADEPWWFFYTLYQFDKVHWGAISQCIPAMLALTFFGILHVPINVPALALQTGEDHADLNHELKLHGFSNLISGCFGSIQNYLVYANTLFFMRSGGDSRLAGFMLAGLTFCVMLVGPMTIGFIPVMMVGCLIFDLGFELLVEAVWEPRKKLKMHEFITVIVIVLVMGIYDFVVGIGVGVLLAFVSLIFQTSQVSAVRAMYAGDIVNSTVRRNHAQHHYLRQVGRQICIIKVAGFLFFGTIVSVEEKIRDLIAEEAFTQTPIRYLIIDLRQVTGLDYSAGEAFNTISRLLDGKGIHLVLSGVDADRALGHDLRAVGLGEDSIDVAFLPDINTALELCENELLKTLYVDQEALACEAGKAVAFKTRAASKATKTKPKNTSSHLQPPSAAGPSIDMLASSPRRNLLQAAARESNTRSEGRRKPKWQNFSEPLRLMLQVFQDISDRNEDFWFRATRYFVRQEFAAGQVLFAAGDAADGFYLLEKGIVRAEYDLPHGQNYHESIVAGTTCGELPFFSDTTRTATAYADLDCVAWVLERDAWNRLQKDDPEVAHELLRVSLKLTAERMSTVPSSTMLMSD